VSDYPPLETLIRKQIAASGPMPVSRYMQICLTHPEYGYYLKRDPLGRDGDFVTAPEVSQMFGELIGLWAASVWSAMGSPSEVKFIELGPGRGTMMADALRAVRILPAFHEAISVHLVEASPTLREKQRHKLADAAHVEWYDSIEDVPDGPAIILANEFFDALPIHQAVKTEMGWHERVIEIDDDVLSYGIVKKTLPRFEVLLPPQVRAAPNGAIFEWRPDNAMITIARRLRDQGGAALIVDYGHARSDAGDTFQAVARHNFTNPLKNAGMADVTAHVDFQALARAAESVGARAHGPVEQGTFLKRLGIENRAQALMKNASEDSRKVTTAGLARLTGPSPEGMGSLFKVLGISHPSIKVLAALSDPVARTVTTAGAKL